MSSISDKHLDFILRGFQNQSDFDIIANIRNKAALKYHGNGATVIGPKILANQVSRSNRLQIAEINGKPVGYTLVTKDGTQEGKIWKFAGPNCLPENEKTGIEEALLDWLVDRAKKAGISTLIRHMRDTSPQEPARDLLTRKGFYEAGGYYYIRLELTGPPKTPRRVPKGLELVDYRGEEDFDVLETVLEAAFRYEEDEERSTNELKQFLGSALKDGYIPICVETSSQKPIGTIAATEMRLPGGKVGYIGTYGVIPSFQGKGIGSLLMERTVDHFWKSGINRIETVVKIENRNALAVYKHLGFQIIPDRTLIVLKKDL